MAWLAQSASCPVTAAATSNGSACRHLVRPADTNRLLSQQHRQMHGHIKEAAIVPLPPVAKSTEEPNALLADGRECHYAPKSHVSSACSAEKPCAAEPTVDPGAHCNRNPGMEGQTAHHFSPCPDPVRDFSVGVHQNRILWYRFAEMYRPLDPTNGQKRVHRKRNTRFSAPRPHSTRRVGFWK